MSRMSRHKQNIIIGIVACDVVAVSLLITAVASDLPLLILAGLAMSWVGVFIAETPMPPPESN